MASLKNKISALLAAEELSPGVVHASFLPGYHRDSIFKSLTDLKEEGLVSESGDLLSLTSQGRQSLRETFPYFMTEGFEWDGLWRLVFFDFPENNRSLRDSFRRFLRSRGFGLWQTSVWVSPFQHDFFTNPELLPQSIRPHLELIQGVRVTPIDEKTMASKIWPLVSLHQAYNRIFETWESCFNTAGTADLEGLKKAASCIQDDYLSLLFDDPGLPKEVLPEDWGGELAASMSWQWRHFLKL